MNGAPRVLVLDHRDSFVFTLVDQFQRCGAEVCTLRTDLDLAELQRYLAWHHPDLVVLSPGPGHPADAGVMPAFLATRPSVPVLGVCLGHQALAHAAGGRVAPAPVPVHGRSCAVTHRGDPAFAGLPDPFIAARYHSLAVAEVPPCFDVVATTAGADPVVMAIRHRELPQLGLQFHPESVLTPCGGRLVSNILDHALSLHRSPSHDPAAHQAGPRG